MMHFLLARDTSAFLYNDADGFSARLTPADLCARRVRSAAEFRAKASRSASDFDADSRRILAERARLVDAWLDTEEGRQAARAKGLVADPDSLRSMPWKFACTVPLDDGYVHEAGMPHTRADVVFVQGTIDASTLLHEKLHVWQRAHPQLASLAVRNAGYLPIAPLAAFGSRARANPDVDGVVYVHYTRPTAPLLAMYTSDHPSSLRDVVQASAGRAEHPYERAAYDLGHALAASSSFIGVASASMGP
jgi:hypothetical protein